MEVGEEHLRELRDAGDREIKTKERLRAIAEYALNGASAIR